MKWLSENVTQYIVDVIRFYQDKTNVLAGTTIGSTVVGTTTQAVKENTEAVIYNNVSIYLDFLSILQYAAYTVSIIVGILTIISWFRRNRKEK